jgi:hypothetical protein
MSSDLPSVSEEMEFLAVPCGWSPAIEEKNLKKQPKYFPQVERSNLSVGKWYYVAIKVSSMKIGYLAKVVHLDEKGVRFQHAEDAYMLAGTTQEEEDPCTQLVFHDGKLQEKVYAVLGAPEQELGQSQEPALKFPFEAWIMEDPSVKRFKVYKSERVSMLGQAAAKAISVNGTDPAKWPEEEDDIVKECYVFVEEAMAKAVEALQVQAAGAGEGKEPDPPNFGTKPSNALIVARTMVKMFEAGSEPKKPAEQSISREFAILSRKVDKMSQQLEMLAAHPAKQAESEGKKHVDAPAKHVEVEEKEQEDVVFISMVPRGACCYQVGGVTRELCSKAGTDLSKIVENVEKQVDDAKQYVIANFATILTWWKDYGLEKGVEDADHFAEEQWKKLMGKDLASIIDRVVGDPAPTDGGEAKEPKVGGINELALCVWDTIAEIMVVDQSGVHAKATDEQVKVACHPAMLEGLPKGPADKTARVFAMRKKGHYYLATINGQAIFNIGKDADEAQDRIIALLKSQQKGPLDEAARLEVIKQAIARSKTGNTGSTWAGVAAGTPAAGQKNATPVADTSKLSKSNTLCRNYEKNGTCSYGENCGFKHDDSRKGRQRQKKQQQAKSALTVVKAKNQQPQQTALQQVPSRERQLKVWCRKAVHPASWRSSLQSIDKAAHKLVTWAERDVADKEWLFVQCKAGDEDKLAKLLRDNFEVEQQSRRPNSASKNRAHHCVDSLNGKNCQHNAPYCK